MYGHYILYLENSSTTAILDTPIANLTIIITGTDKILFTRVDVHWHDSRRMSCKRAKWIAWLQIGIIYPLSKSIQKNQGIIITLPIQFR